MSRTLQPGQHGEVVATPQKRTDDGKWRTATNRRSADRWRARAYYRGWDGVESEKSCVAQTRAAAEAAVTEALARVLNPMGDVAMTSRTSITQAGELWLTSIRRTDSGKSARTVQDYERTFRRYITEPAGKLRSRPGGGIAGFTLAEINDTQRLRTFLQAVADVHGTSAAKSTRSVLAGVLNLAVDNGVVPGSALKNVRAIASQTPRAARTGLEPRDTTRAFTEDQRTALIAYADGLASGPHRRPSTGRKWVTTADLVAFMAGTGTRITEARSLRWDDVDLTPAAGREHPGVLIRGTKSRSSRRYLTIMSGSALLERLVRRHAQSGGEGYVFSAPHLTGSTVDADGAPLITDPHERIWEQSNCAKAVAQIIRGAELSWATPHTLRRTVATVAHKNGAPLVAIADHLGHADPSMTLRVYIGRDPMAERVDVAQFQ